MLSNLAIAYLFFGGAGAGALAVLIICDFLSPQASRIFLERKDKFYAPQPSYYPFFRMGFQTAGAALVLAVLCLLFDLGRPDIVLLLFTNPTLSYIGIGAWVLALTVFCAIVLAVIWSVCPRGVLRVFVRVVEWAGLIASLATAAYTGLLFWSIGEGLLLGSLFLPLLFVLSSFSTGLALLFLGAGLTGATHRFASTFARLIRLDIIIIILEIASLTALMLTAASGQASSLAVHALIAGDYAPVFWVGIVSCGLVAPFAFEAPYLLRVKPPAMERIVIMTSSLPAALLVLAGGFCLRWGIIGAGIPLFSSGILVVGG
jgi:formate-dependent nitrite reductase membrane component NrfD